MSLRVRSADRLGLNLAVTGSPKVKAAKRVARLRATGAEGYVWSETEQEFGLYREQFSKPEDVCVTCLKGGNKSVVTGRYDYVDGWGTKGWIRTCLVHGTNPTVKQFWSIGRKEKRVVAAIAHVIRACRAGRKGNPPVREAGWASLEKDIAKVYAFQKGVR
jgi:hypothetical protein